MPHLLRSTSLFGALCLAALLLAFAGGPPNEAFAEEPPAAEDEDEPRPDLGDKDVPFTDQVNEAIEKGTEWMLARGTIFPIPGARDDEEGAHYGLTKGNKLYDPNGKGDQYRNPAGCTALALYTMLKCGVSPNHQVIKKGFNWLRVNHRITEEWDGKEGDGNSWTHTEAAGTYELSVMVLALTAKYDRKKHTGRVSRRKKKISDKDDLEWMIEMVDGLVKRRGMPAKESKPEDMLGWRYNIPEVRRGGGGGGGRRGGGRSVSKTWVRGGGGVLPQGNQDLSSTQLAALALYNAGRFGIKVDPQVWTDIATLSLKHQETEGPLIERHDPAYRSGGYAVPKDMARGFAYLAGNHGKESVATGSMTACGIANLVMAKDFLSNHRKAKKDYLGSDLCRDVDKGILDGLAWLDRNWSPFLNVKKGGYHVYYLYSLERAMDLLGRRLVGKRLWYPEGAKQLLKRQQRVEVSVPGKKSGRRTEAGVFWNTGSTHDPKDVLDTCFALLYLKRATEGVMPPVEITGN